MECRIIDTEEVLKFLCTQATDHGLFLQTPAWLELERQAGNWGEVVGFWEADVLVGSSMVVERTMRGGFKYHYSPRGPVADGVYLPAIIELLKNRYKDKGVFLRLEPALLDSQPEGEVFKNNGWLKTASIQPDSSLIIDLSKDDDKLLAEMHPKTRYNIRLGQKKSLDFKILSADGLPDFLSLLKETSQRDGFGLHSERHYQTMIDLFGQNEFVPDSKLAVKIVEVRKSGILLAANLLVAFNKTVVYLHGASSNQWRELMPAYYLHWQTMKLARSSGFKFYDFWGISSQIHYHQPWSGITRFKVGFGGRVVDYLGVFDYPYRKLMYFIYRVVKFISG